MGIINRSGEHLLGLINDVLDLSKIEAGQMHLKVNSFDLYALLESVRSMYELRAETKGLSLTFEQTAQVPRYIKTDEKKLRQVLLNLLGNALKFTLAGNVTLRVSAVTAASLAEQQPRHTLIFEVVDTGCGIATDELDSLFSPFVQTETGRKSEQGTGLGLSISRQFVRLLGGEITVSSQVGIGSTFKFDIQAELGEPEQILLKPPVLPVVGLEPGQPPYRILVVDDRWENRQLLVKLLEPIGFEVRQAEDGKVAIAVWQQWQPHLIWMDMRMPVMNGYEATQQIKSHLQGQATVIIALTASTLEEEKKVVLSAGCNDFVRKPFSEQVIFDKLAQYLGVRYTYAEGDRFIAPVLSSEQKICDIPLTAHHLLVMPMPWLQQLSQASEQLDQLAIAQLLAQIPTEHANLSATLQQKVDDFDFDQILMLSQQAISLGVST